MSRDFERLEALRRITVKRGATKAEAATAKRLAKALKAKIGKCPRTRRRQEEAMPLPEPLWARKRRICGNWLEWVLWRACVLCAVALVFYVLLTPALIFTMIFGGEAMQHHFDNLAQAKMTILTVFVPFACVVMPALAIALWWLRAEPGTRLRTAAKFICYLTPLIAIFKLCFAIFDHIERVMRLSGFWELAFFLASFGVCHLCINAWYRWGHPVLERRLGPIES